MTTEGRVAVCYLSTVDKMTTEGRVAVQMVVALYSTWYSSLYPYFLFGVEKDNSWVDSLCIMCYASSYIKNKNSVKYYIIKHIHRNLKKRKSRKKKLCKFVKLHLPTISYSTNNDISIRH